MPSLTAAFCLSALFLVTSVRAADTPEKIQFNRDIRPILSENCFYCHGQDASHREAKLRLDERDDGGVIGVAQRERQDAVYRRMVFRQYD